MLKNAIAYILRKRNRTIIVFIILTVVLSCLFGKKLIQDFKYIIINN